MSKSQVAALTKMTGAESGSTSVGSFTSEGVAIRAAVAVRVASRCR